MQFREAIKLSVFASLFQAWMFVVYRTIHKNSNEQNKNAVSSIGLSLLQIAASQKRLRRKSDLIRLNG
jgi:DUF2946 family protein